MKPTPFPFLQEEDVLNRSAKVDGKMQRRKCMARGFNLSVLCAFLLTFGLIFFYAQPLVKRGFFCDDESLAHPVKPNTVPTWTLMTVSLLVPMLVVVVVEAGLLGAGRSQVLLNLQDFLFGFFVNLLFTELTKYTIGRLRCEDGLFAHFQNWFF